MSRRSTPPLHTQGVSRIFQQSVKQLGQRESHGSIEGKKEWRQRDYESKDKNQLNNVKERKLSSRNTNQFKTDRESVYHMSASNSKPGSVVSERPCQRQKDRESNQVTEEKLVTSFIINHFAEDWTSDELTPETFDTNTSEYGPLQSTPKFQSELAERYADKFDNATSAFAKKNEEKVAQFVDQNNKEVNSDRTLYNDNILHEKKLPLNSHCSQSVGNELNKVQKAKKRINGRMEVISSVKEIHKSFDSKEKCSAVAGTRQHGFSVHKNKMVSLSVTEYENKENICIKETQMEIDMFNDEHKSHDSDKHSSQIIIGDTSSFEETLVKEDKTKALPVNQINTSNIPPVQNDTKAICTLNKSRGKDKDRNGHYDLNMTSRGYEYKSHSLHSNEPWKMRHPHKYKGNESKCNWSFRHSTCTNNRKNQHELKPTIPPRFSKKHSHPREQKSYRSLCKSASEKGMKKLLISNDQVKLVDICDRPVFSKKFGQLSLGLTDSVHHSKVKEPVQSSEIGTEEKIVVSSQDVEIKEKPPDACQPWIIPCSEDWLAEITEEKNGSVFKQDNINNLNAMDTTNEYDTNRTSVYQTIKDEFPLKNTVSFKQPNTSGSKLVCGFEHREDKYLIACEHERFTIENTEDFEVNKFEEGLEFDKNKQDVKKMDKLNKDNDLDNVTYAEQTKEMVKNSMPYLPPPPPCSDYMYVPMKGIPNADENYIADKLAEKSATQDNILLESEGHNRNLTPAGDEYTVENSYVLACKDDETESTKRGDKFDKLIGCTSEDVSELPSNEVVNNISIYDNCSLDQSCLEMPDSPESQENTLDYGSDYETCVDTTKSQYSQWPMDCMTDDDSKNWLNFQYDSAYWSWYYYMCSKSIKNNMEWQSQAYNKHVNNISKRKVQQSGRRDKIECNHKEKKSTGNHSEPLTEVPSSDLVTDRTTSWVNSQIFHNPSSQTSTHQSHVQENGSQKHNTGESHYFEVKTPNNNYDKINAPMDANDATRQHWHHLSSVDTDQNVTSTRDMDRGEGLYTCYCMDRSIQYVTWRMCYCGPPRLCGVYYRGDTNTDLGYWSYESNTGTDQEERTLLDKGNGMLYQPPSTSEYQWAPSHIMEGKCMKKHLYGEFVGGRDPPGFQQVYMLHSTAPEEVDKDRKRLSSHRFDSDRSDHEMDENQNNRQLVDRNSGKLRKIIEEMDGDSLSQKSVKCTDNVRRGSRMSESKVYKDNVFDCKQDVPMESLHSKAHLSEVEKNLTEAEEVNDKLGKSFFIMKNAISAIKQYTDQLKTKCDHSALSTEHDLDSSPCEIDKTDGLDSGGCTKPEPNIEKTIHDDFVQKQEKTGDRVRPKVRPFKFKVERRYTFGCDSSHGHLSDSSDEFCKESILSQSPDKSSKADSYTNQFLSNLYKRKPRSLSMPEPPRMIPRHIHSYRGGGSKSAVGGDWAVRSSGIGYWDSDDLSVESSYKGPWNRKPPISYDTIKATSGQWHVEPSFPAYSMQFIENKYRNKDVWFDGPKHTDINKHSTVGTVTSKCKTPPKHTGSEEKDGAKTYKPWKPKLVDYTESGESSSDIEIEPFDVDSLSGDYNPSSGKEESIELSPVSQHKPVCSSDYNPNSGREDSSNISPVSHYKPKKWKHDMLDNMSSSSYDSSRVDSPVEFMTRPQRKLSHRRLKCLSAGDIPPVTFMKASTAHRKHPQQYANAESKAKLHQRYNTEHEMVSTKSKGSLSTFIANQKKSLPPMSPFPQSQFWNMYLPKYNSALTGTQESIPAKPEESQDNRVSGTPELRMWTPKSTLDSKNETTVSQLDKDTWRPKKNNSDWRNTFKRFHSFGVKYIDTHCHLDFLFKREGFRGNLKDYMTQFPDTFPDTFEGCVAVFCNPLTFNPEGGLWKEVAKEDNVWFAMGCHPKNATDFSEDSEEGLLKCLLHSKCVALGEIGLDYSGTFQQHEEVQKMVFRKQLKIAVNMGKPLVIHCRQAEDDCLDILKEMVPKDHKIHCHCFTGYYYNAKRWLEAFPNLYIGVTPLVTYATARPSHDLARNIPLNRLLLETDAPYFIPRCIPRDDLQYSNPGLAVTVAKEIAQYQELPVAAVLRYCRLNTKAMYGI